MAGADTGSDASGDTRDAAPDGGAVTFPDVCDELSMSRRELRTTGTGAIQDEVAAPFVVETLDGRYRLVDHWTGCDSYVFLNYFPDLRATPSGAWYGDTLFGTLPDPLFQESPRNVHYFFTSFEEDASARRTRMEALRASIEEGLELGIADEVERAFWRSRFHFVLDRSVEITGGPGDYLRSYMTYLGTPESIEDLGERGRAQAPLPFVFGIAREQTFDPGGTMDVAVGRGPSFRMAAYLGHFYNHRARVADRFAAETATTVVPFLDARVTEREHTVTVTLPDAAAMASFDTFEIDLEDTCEHRNPFACSEWDRIALIELCTAADCAERREIARWITPYWRRGRARWVMDASAFLGLVAAGGEQTFRVILGPTWERATERRVQVSARLSTRGARPRGRSAVLAFGSNAFDDSYNARAPFAFTPPAGASRVELVVILSGHGQTAGDNCAEWCDHRHTFSVNGTDLAPITHTGEAIGSAFGCAARADDGVVPGQWGNWSQARAYWCPGLPVDPIRIDITSRVTLGAENTLGLRGTLGAAAPRGGDIALSAYVVTYE